VPPSAPSIRGHPRACGEKVASRRVSISTVGSSPRLRGEAVTTRIGSHSAGVIPAPAGRRVRLQSWTVVGQGHPRACGEKANTPTDPVVGEGSSPRLRGEGVLFALRGGYEGVIPAPAGRSGTGKVGLNPEGGHPRACGEKRRPPGFASRASGSSPRLRGEARSASSRGARPRVIPAPAGRR